MGTIHEGNLAFCDLFGASFSKKCIPSSYFYYYFRTVDRDPRARMLWRRAHEEGKALAEALERERGGEEASSITDAWFMPLFMKTYI